MSAIEAKPEEFDLRAAIRRVAVYALERREFWARRPGEIDAARAVAYQHVAGMLIQALSEEHR